jgi:putative addiction module component (TIGR02574 family)
MAVMNTALRERVRELPDTEKLALVDEILAGLDRPDPRIDRVWAQEARRRWLGYKSGRVRVVPYARVMARYRRHEG